MNDPVVSSMTRANDQMMVDTRTTYVRHLPEPGEGAEREVGAQHPIVVNRGFALRSIMALNASMGWPISVLTVSEPHDASERQAELVADSVIDSMSGPYVRPLGEPSNAAADGALDVATKRRFEPYFGDLSKVRVHTDNSAAKLAADLGANAFTIGSDISFARGKYAPGSPRGLKLLAHEVAHVKSATTTDGVIYRDPDTSGHNEAANEAPPPHGSLRAVSSADTDKIRTAMDGDPAQGSLAALQLLKQYQPDDIVEMLIELDGEHRLERIAGEIRTGDVDAVVGVIATVLYLSPNRRASPSWGTLAAHVVAGLPEARRLQLMEHVLRASGRAHEVPALRAQLRSPNSVIPRAATPAPARSNGAEPQPWWRFTEAGFQYETGRYDLLPTQPGVDTGYAPWNFVANSVISLSNVMTIPFNAASQLVSAPEAIARAVGADEQDIQAMNFALLMTGIEELNMPRQMAQSATAANQGKTVASMWTEATDAANAIKEGKTASTTATSSEAIGSLRSTQLPPEYFDEAMSRLEQGDLRTSGDLISDLTSHAQSAAARAERGLSAQTGQSAHISARSAMRGVAGYDPRAALTRLLDSTAHRGFDDYWKAVFRRMANSSGETQISVADYFNVMRDAIGNNPHFTNGEAISMVELLRDELFVQYGLRDADMLRLPYSRGL